MATPAQSALPRFPPVEVGIDDLVRLRAFAHPVEDRRSRGLTGFPGAVRTGRRGQGLEFEDLRPYAPGDDVRHIDWNVTARTTRPHVRLYAEERERALTVAVDLRPSMYTGSERLRAARAVELAARTLWRAAAEGDRCAAVAMTVDGIVASPPRTGERGALGACGLVAEAYAGGLSRARSAKDGAAHDEVAHGGAGPEALLRWLNGAGRTAGARVLFTAGDGLGEAGLSLLREAGARRDTALVLTLDPLECGNLLPGRYSVDGARVRIDGRAAHAANRAMASRIGVLEREISATGIALVLDDGRSPPASVIGRLFGIGGRRR